VSRPASLSPAICCRHTTFCPRLQLFETSAQDGQDIELPFQALAKLIHTGPVMDME